MADNTLLNSGSGGDTMRSKDRAGVKTEIVGIDLGIGGTELLQQSVAHDAAYGSTTPIAAGFYADTDGDSTTVADADLVRGIADLHGRQWVNPIRRTLTSSVTISSGLNTAAYVAGDQVGPIQTVSSSAARVSGGGGILRAVTIAEDADLIGMIDVVFYSASITLAADSSAYNIATDADAAKIVGIVSVNVADIGANRYGNAAPFLPYWCDATSLFFSLIARSAFAASLTNIRCTFNLEFD
jgi:hypothetical protein